MNRNIPVAPLGNTLVLKRKFASDKSCTMLTFFPVSIVLLITPFGVKRCFRRKSVGFRRDFLRGDWRAKSAVLSERKPVFFVGERWKKLVSVGKRC